MQLKLQVFLKKLNPDYNSCYEILKLFSEIKQ